MAARRASAHSSALRRTARPIARSRSAPGSASSRPSRRAARSSCSSRTSTGRTTRCSSSSTGSSTGRRDLPILVLCTGRPELYETPSGLGRRQAELDDRLALPALDTRRRHGSSPPSSRRRCCRPRRSPRSSTARAATRSTRRSTCGCSSSSARAEDLPLPDTRPGAHRRAARHAAAGAESRCSRTLPSSARCSGPARSRRWATAGADDVRDGLHQLARKELCGRRGSPPSKARPSTCSGTRSSATSPTARSRAAPRATKHIAVADWIETMAGERVVDHSELLAHHTTRGDRARAGGRRARPTRSSSSGRRGTSCSRAIARSSSTSARRLRATAGLSSCSPRARRSTASRS